MYRNISLSLLVLMFISGCATKWYHSSILDEDELSKKLVIDEGYCRRISSSASPIPQVAYSDVEPKTSNVFITGNTYSNNSSYSSSYTGNITTYTSPAASFAAGMANGMNIGAAFAASKNQDAIYEGCMIEKGWSKTPVKVENNKNLVNESKQSINESRYELIDLFEDKIYKNSEEEWYADIEELFLVLPQYEESNDLYNALNDEVKRIAADKPSLNGPQILVNAHDNLVKRKVFNPKIIKKDKDYEFLMSSYSEAASGSIAGSIAMGFLNSKGVRDAAPNMKRATFWYKKAAENSDPMGMFLYGRSLFNGYGIQKNRENGYILIQQASQMGEESAKKYILDIESQMTSEELSKFDLIRQHN